MSTVLHNTKPINIEGKYTFITYSKYQAIEEYYYESLPGPAYGVPAGYNEWTLDSGALPPGLQLELNTGIVKGTVSNTTGSDFLIRLLQAYPGSISVSSLSGSVSPSTYKIDPSIAGPDNRIIITFNFSVQGWDLTPLGVPKQKGVLLPCQISVLKNFRGDVEEWKQWEPYFGV